MKLHQLSIGYPHKVIGQNLSAQLSKASLTALVGVNGAGKSTLLRTLTGEQKPIAGEVLLSGKPIQSYSRGERARQIAVVLTQRVEASQMLAEEVVALGRLPYTNLMGSLKTTDLEVINQAISITGITHLRQRQIGALSDGERQRVMLAKALAQETPFILMDEPTAFLDAESRIAVLETLRELTRTPDDMKPAVLFSTHDLHDGLKVADRVFAIGSDGLFHVSKEDDASRKATVKTIFRDI